jgi:hypothetical protein
MGQASTGFSKIPARRAPQEGRFSLVLAIAIAVLAAASTIAFLISLIHG